MCQFVDNIENPAKKLAGILAADLDVSVNPTLLRLFIRTRWDDVAPLAHAIHGTKKSPDAAKLFAAAMDALDAYRRIFGNKGCWTQTDKEAFTALESALDEYKSA